MTGFSAPTGSVDGTATYLQVLADKRVISGDAASLSIQFGLLIACLGWALGLSLVTRGRLSYPRYRAEAEQLDLYPSTPPAPPPRVGD